jgi:hypothetical protein
MIVTGSTEQIRDILCGPQQHNEHCKGWRWELYVRDQRNSRAAREAMLMAEVRKIGAERRERLSALRGEVLALEAADRQSFAFDHAQGLRDGGV